MTNLNFTFQNNPYKMFLLILIVGKIMAVIRLLLEKELLTLMTDGILELMLS